MRRSSVRALNASPHTASVTPSTDPPAAVSTLLTTRSNCSMLTCVTPRSSPKSYPASSAIRIRAAVSLGKHWPTTSPPVVTTVPASGTFSE